MGHFFSDGKKRNDMGFTLLNGYPNFFESQLKSRIASEDEKAYIGI